MKKKTYALRLYGHNPSEPKGRIIPLSEVGRVKEKFGNKLLIETETHVVALLSHEDDGELLVFPWAGGGEVSAWIYRKIEGIELEDDFSDDYFKFVDPNN